MSSLISLVVVDQEPRVDSRLLAEQLGVEHKATRQLILQYQADLEEFGKVPFEMEASGKTNQQQKFALLNEDQSYLLLTYSQNTEQARALKKRLVRAFGEQRRSSEGGSVLLPPCNDAHDLPVIESSMVLDFQGTPIRFLIDREGNWQAVYADLARALGYVTKEQQYNARNILKIEVKGENKQLRHPLYGDLIYAAGIPKFLGRFTRYQAGSFDKFLAAGALQKLLDKTAKSMINQPVAAGRLLESTQARAMEIAPMDWEFTQAVQVFE